MYSSWTKGLTEEEKQQWTHIVSSSTPFIKRFIKIVEEKQEAVDNMIKDKTSYEKAAWSEYQADCIGQYRAYSTILKLLNNLN